jgi:hypothetical protein
MLWPGVRLPQYWEQTLLKTIEALIYLKGGVLTCEEILVFEELPCSVIFFFNLVRFT